MATPQWERLKETIDGLTAAQIPGALRFFSVTSEGTDHRNRQAIARAAYNSARANAAQYSSITAAYDAARHGLSNAIAGASSYVPAESTADRNAREAREAAEAARMGIHTATAQSATTGEGERTTAEIVGQVSELLARVRELEAMSARDAAGLAAIVAEAVAKRPPMTIEVTNNGQAVATFDGTQHCQFGELLRAVSARQCDGFRPSVWLAGPAGSGKTFASVQLAGALGLGFEYNGALSMAHELSGYRDAAGTYHDTPFRRAYEGGLLYLFDEVDACADNSPLMAMNAALANGRASFPDKQVARHRDNVIVAGANTFGLGATADYIGRIKLDAAFLDRFPVKIFWNYDEALELAMAGNETWARKVQRARAQAKAAGLKVLITPRATVAGAALIAAGFSLEDAARMTYLANLTAEQARMIGA